MFNKRKIPKELRAKALEIFEESMRKQLEYEELVSQPLKYEILQDLVNSALPGSVIEVVLADGSTLKIKRNTPYDDYLDGANY